jgi:hypothetical protein
MSAASNESAHRDHMAWHQEGDLWREELAIWEKDVSDGLAEIGKLEAEIRKHAESLARHAAAIRLGEHEFLGHEHAVAEYEQDTIPLRLLERFDTHVHETETHAKRRSTHEALKRQHHELMARWKSVFLALSAGRVPR